MELRTPTLQGVDLLPQWQDLPNPYASVTRCDLTASSVAEVTVSDLPTVVVDLGPGEWTAHWFTSDWGDEFTPQEQVITGALHLGITSGRSSKGMHPWALFERADGEAVVVSPAWSGNWRIDVEPTADGVRVLAGISAWEFARTVRPGRPFRAPSVYLASAASRADATAGLAAAVSRWVTPRTPDVPLTWNHWWPYEDQEINTGTFLADVAVARELGYELAVLDAGWFGGADEASDWWKIRGDWDEENTVRFPDGVAGLAAATRAAGVEFGVWCEIEALGFDARIAAAKPEIVARRDGDPDYVGIREDDSGWLGYVCLGSPAGREHVLDVLDRLIGRTGARWLKVDFNLDPGPGCSRTDHGHEAGDGLYEHYVGLYSVLDELRGRYPQLVVEDCSSGGLRLDLGLLAHVHCGFLSDPDWTEFQLQLLWGISQMLPAASIYHFSESQWRTHHPRQHLDPKTISTADYDASLRAVSLHRFALSQKLHELPDALRDRVRAHAADYQDHVIPALREHGVIRPLTAQPRRDGGGERWPAFQLTAGDSHVVMAIALDGAGEDSRVRPLGLAPETIYSVRLLGPDADPADLGTTDGLGAELGTEGILLRRASGATSWLLVIEEEDA
ncbi:MAG TPA: alpha-galactosidase [Propionicimonas sp.]|jgi:alpha-galactosidase